MPLVRRVLLSNILLPIRVNHSHLSHADRIDAKDSRIDILKVSLDVYYRHQGDAKAKTMSDVWNYGDLYPHLCESDVPTLTSALETVLDEIADRAYASLTEQRLTPLKVHAIAERMGLSVGWPKLETVREYHSGLPRTKDESRRAGIENWPVNVSVDHAWCVGNERVEHADVRHEDVSVSFSVQSKQCSINENLSGLYNYSALIGLIQGFGGIAISGPVEELGDLLMKNMLNDAKESALDVKSAHVLIKRGSYARLTPSIGLLYFN